MRLINLLFKCFARIEDKDSDNLNQSVEAILKKGDKESSFCENNDKTAISDSKLDISKIKDSDEKSEPKISYKILLFNLEESPDPIILFERKEKGQPKTIKKSKKKVGKSKENKKKSRKGMRKTKKENTILMQL
ncbi:unnamed protein product [Blepharisma stoltei]|uniref:Uncharacterized protein n=1 Tax=Blepharisma stoltei TaxID=1481888 RepID=A0AAU9JYV9_9CILI|nr:unnamed protein product [Blepharisma stoltei]